MVEVRLFDPPPMWLDRSPPPAASGGGKAARFGRFGFPLRAVAAASCATRCSSVSGKIPNFGALTCWCSKVLVGCYDRGGRIFNICGNYNSGDSAMISHYSHFIVLASGKPTVCSCTLAGKVYLPPKKMIFMDVP